jgi:PTH1 family peptidyl-tRNA hydrolase
MAPNPTGSGRGDPVPRCLVVGLGNPGPEYVGTRHNVGFEVLDVLARRWKVEFEPNKLVQGHAATAFPPGLPVDRVRLVKPMTYMNLCGPSYAKALKVFEAEVAGALVVVDDFMMDFGRLRLRADGSSGGHNGLKSIEGAVGAAYPRLKVGIGTPPNGRDPADFVLSRYAAVERKELPFVLEEAADAVVTWLAAGMEKAMERHNRKKDA